MRTGSTRSGWSRLLPSGFEVFNRNPDSGLRASPHVPDGGGDREAPYGPRVAAQDGRVVQVSETNPNVVWTYGRDRHVPGSSRPRTGIRAPLSSELTGVDPLYEGGLRPFSGFRQVHFFQLTSADHWVTDVFSGDFSIGTGYGYYFVCRVQDP